MWSVEGLAVPSQRSVWVQEGSNAHWHLTLRESAEAFKILPKPSHRSAFTSWTAFLQSICLSARRYLYFITSPLIALPSPKRHTLYFKRNVLVISCLRLLKSCLDVWRLSMQFFCHSLNHLLFVRQYFLYTFHEPFAMNKTKKCV